MEEHYVTELHRAAEPFAAKIGFSVFVIVQACNRIHESTAKVDISCPRPLLPLGEAIASRAVFVIVSGSDGRTETLLEPVK